MQHTIKEKNFSIGNLSFINELEIEFLIYEIFHQSNYLANFLTLNPGSIIIDVGANIGIFSLFAIKKCSGDAQIYSFEPIPITFHCLQKNLSPHKNTIKTYHQGIANVSADCYKDFTLFGQDIATATYQKTDKLLSNYAPLLHYNTLLKMTQTTNKRLHYALKYLPFMRNYLIKQNHQQQTRQTTIQCPVTSLGDFIEKQQLTQIDFLKIDVEGAESDVINSIYSHQFSMIKQCSIEVHNINDRVKKMSLFLREKGFSVQSLRNPMFEQLGFNHHMIYAKRS